VRKHILHGAATCDYLWIDETSQVDVCLLNQLGKLSFTKACFLLSGDFWQFGAIKNCWKGTPVAEDAMERSALLHTLAGGNRCTLTECMRGDRRLFDFCSSLIRAGSRFELPLRECVAQAKALFVHNGACPLEPRHLAPQTNADQPEIEPSLGPTGCRVP
jgi:hypothetical protein